MPNDTTPTLEERNLAIQERKLALEDRALAIQERAAMTSAEAAFNLEMRQAQSLAASPFLPANVGKDPKERVAAAWGVLRFAAMLNVDPYVLAQQIYVVHGRVGFSTSFLIGLVNERAGLRKAIDWTVTGTGDKMTATATATDKDGVERSVSMTFEQSRAWGWTSKSDPWRADPALMLCYRAASKLIRLYFSGAVMGLSTAEEVRDAAAVIDVEPTETARKGFAALGLPPRQIVEQLPPVEFAPTDARDPVPTGYGADFTPPAPGEPA